MGQTTRRIALFFSFTFSLAVLSNIIEAQTFTVLHTFRGGADGADPYVGVTVTNSGLLYGTTYGGGNSQNDGIVFALRHSGSGWTLNPLYQFSGPPNDGANPFSPILIGRNGSLYGTTQNGGSANDGTVFKVQPPPNPCHAALCYWNETVLHSFQGSPNDGASPTSVNLIFDQTGNIYGTTSYGGPSNVGTVFELASSGSGWTIHILHSFSDMDGQWSGGQWPIGGLIFDDAGNLFGTTAWGGIGEGTQGVGTAFELSPSGSGAWTETVINEFNCLTGGCNPDGNLIRNASGNFYGDTYAGESGLFELSYSDGAWVFTSLPISGGGVCEPYGGMTIDSAGNLYGSCLSGGAYDDGWVYKLTNSGGSWTITDLHDFDGADGAWPYGGVALDSSGNLYGTAFYGGDLGCNFGLGCGTVWEITP